MAGTNKLDAAKVGRRIRKRRLEVGISQRELGDGGASYAYLSRVEAGSRDPSLSALIAIAARMRAVMAAEIASLDGTKDADRLERVAELHRLEAETTGLYLLTGSTHDPCPLCGRHEQGDTTDGKGRPRRSRH